MRIERQRNKRVPALPSIVSISPLGYPSAWLRPRIACSRFARHDACRSTASFGLNFRMARYTARAFESPETCVWGAGTPPRKLHCVLAHEATYARFKGRVHHIWTGERHSLLTTLERE